MEKNSTKAQILEAALDLFSVKGFEATSIAQIADAVGIRKASLYSHFTSKQDILDTLMAEQARIFNEHSIFAMADWNDPKFTKNFENMSVEKLVGMVKGQIQYVIHDPDVSRVRRMLTIEQFQNEKLRDFQSKFSYEDILKYSTNLMKFLIEQGVLKAMDPEIMAAQYAWPVSMWTFLCDREPEREAEAMELMDRHIRQFFEIYKK